MIVDKAKGYFKSWDMFPTSEFLRYKDDSSKATYTGAFLSLIIYGIIIYLVVIEVLKSINKTDFTWSQTTEK